MTESSQPQPLRAVCYLRLSQASAHLEDTLTRQREDTSAYCQARGYTVVSVVEDGGISAYKGKRDRPGYNQVLDLIRRGEVDRVVCYNVDRLHRSTRQLLDYLELCRTHGVITEATQGAGINPMSSDGVLLATILGSVTEQESNRKSERVHRAQRQAAEQGKFNRGARYRTFGYTRDGEVIPEERDAVREAADRLLAGESLNRIVRDLADRGVTTTTGRPIYHQRVRDILRNPKTAGLSTWNPKGTDGRYSPMSAALVVGTGQWEPLLDRETWEAVVALLDNPERVTNHVGSRPRWLLSGIATCGVCGATLRVKTITRYGVRERRYSCRNTGDGRRHVSRKVEVIDPYVTGWVLSRLEQMDLGRYLAASDDRDDSAAASLVARRGELEQRLADLEAQLANVTGSAVSVVMRAVAKVSAELDDVVARLAEVNQAEGGSAVTAVVGTEDLVARWETLDLETQRAIVRELVTVTVLPGKSGPRPFDPELVEVSLNPRAAGAVASVAEPD